jgi:Tfp pilus assembly protein PilZ
MHFVPVIYENPEEFLASRWSDGGEGITVLSKLAEIIVGDEVILEITIRGTRDKAVVRGNVVWKREREDSIHRMPAGAGVRIHERDLDKITALSRQVGAGHKG